MAFNVQGTVSKDTRVQVALNNFGGLVTEVPPINVPEGASPDNQELIFWPGKVGSRPGFKKVFGTAVGTVTFTYGKSYIDNQKVVRNLFLASDGTLYLEDDPPTSIGVVTPGTYAKSVTAFGREYIAVSDGLHGQDVPLQYDGTFLDRVTQDGPGAPPSITSIGYDPVDLSNTGGFALHRVDNVVTVRTVQPHNLKVGYLAQIQGVAAGAVITSIAPPAIHKITIDNTENPGIATIEMNADAAMYPGMNVIIVGVPPSPVAQINAVYRAGGIIVFSTTTPHNLEVGASVTIKGTGNATVDNMVYTVQEVSDTITFKCSQDDTDLVLGPGGTAYINWPQSGNSQAQATYQVVAAPAPNKFQIALTYSNGIWLDSSPAGELDGANILFAWDGTFFVSKVINSTTFEYQQYGPEMEYSDPGGTVTPKGQVAPGKHQMQVLYLTRQGYVTRPSPPIKFIANGDQYLSVTNIPIGPPNIVARILAFTGAEGANFYYIPVPAQVNGQVVSTATQINDNSTTTVVLDFGDPTLFAGIQIDTIGNDLASQVILDSCLGFGFYGQRLLAYGMRNTIQNLLGMSFDSGYFASNPTLPTGWTASGTGQGGSLATGHYGRGWQFSGAGGISQSFYLDAYGATIAQPNGKYTARAWIKGVGNTVRISISSSSTGFSSDALLVGDNANGSWQENPFPLPMPATIPTDLRLGVSGSGGMIDELSIIFTENPFLDRIVYGSYVDNPEGFDWVSGIFGPVDDTHKIMDMAVIRSTLYMLTRDPSGRLHATVNNGTTEPAGWTVVEVASMCGALSAFGLTVSQADDLSGAGGEQWMAWASQTGARIFGGDQPWKITQEIQDPGFAQPGWMSIVIDAATTIWALNDPTARRIYFGLPIGTVGSPAVDAAAPTVILHLDYKDLDTAYEIAQASPYRATGRGSLAAPFIARKWNFWHRPMNSAAIMVRADNLQVPVFMGGNGYTPNTQPGFGNVYTLASQCSDDDYGAFFPYWTSYFFVNHELEAALGLGGQRKLLQFLQFFAQIPSGSPSTTGHLTVTIYPDSLANPWPISFQRNIIHDPKFDIETPGGNSEGHRFAIQFAWFSGAI